MVRSSFLGQSQVSHTVYSRRMKRHKEGKREIARLSFGHNQVKEGLVSKRETVAEKASEHKKSSFIFLSLLWVWSPEKSLLVSLFEELHRQLFSSEELRAN